MQEVMSKLFLPFSCCRHQTHTASWRCLHSLMFSQPSSFIDAPTVPCLSFLKLFFTCIDLLIIYVGECFCYGMYIEVRGQQLGVGSLLLLYGFEDQIQVVRLGGECLYPLSHQISPIYSISNPSLPSTSQSTQTSTLTRNFITVRLEGTLTQVKQR